QPCQNRPPHVRSHSVLLLRLDAATSRLHDHATSQKIRFEARDLVRAKHFAARYRTRYRGWSGRLMPSPCGSLRPVCLRLLAMHNRVPTSTPSAPSISAATSPRPSPTPPAAATGTSGAAPTTAGTNGKVLREIPCPPPFCALRYKHIRAIRHSLAD